MHTLSCVLSDVTGSGPTSWSPLALLGAGDDSIRTDDVFAAEYLVSSRHLLLICVNFE